MAVFSFLKNFIGLKKLFMILYLQKVFEAERRFKLFTASDGLKEALEAFLSFHEEFLRHFIWFEGKRWD